MKDREIRPLPRRYSRRLDNSAIPLSIHRQTIRARREFEKAVRHYETTTGFEVESYQIGSVIKAKEGKLGRVETLEAYRRTAEDLRDVAPKLALARATHFNPWAQDK